MATAVFNTVFKPECSLPEGTVNFVAAPNVRGTLDILWSSLSVLLLCTWSILHLNIPPQVTPRNWKQQTRRALFFARRKVTWMLITLIAPEFTASLAFGNLLTARNNKKMMKDFADQDGVAWTLTHAYFADMGGIIIDISAGLKTGDGKSENVPNDVESSVPGPESFNSTHIFQPNTSLLADLHSTRSGNGAPNRSITLDDDDFGFAAFAQHMESHLSKYGDVTWNVHPEAKAIAIHVSEKMRRGEQQYDDNEYDFLRACQGDRWVLDAQQLVLTRKYGLIDLPNITQDDLDDKNKGDIIVKILAVLQVSWLAVQLIIRKTHNLPSSQLEIVTLAFAACAGMTYAMLWYKPQDARIPVYVTAKRFPIPEELAQIVEEGPVGALDRGKTIWMPSSIRHKTGNRYNHASSISIFALAFGGLHLLAWNFHFPSRIEEVLWHVASILTMALPALMAFLTYLSDKIEEMPQMVQYWPYILNLLWWVIGSCGFLYVLARLFIMVEVFRALCFLPPGAYIATWTGNVPHLV